jgi:resuscitation-promoting factor RpfA
MPAPSQGPVRAVWVRLAQCESSGRWHVNTGNGYFGGLQQDMTFWRNYGYDVDHPGALMAARPDLATPGQQVIAAERGLKAQGFGAWPTCSRRLGLR